MDQFARQMSRMQSLLDSMSPEMRRELEEMTDSLLDHETLEELADLAFAWKAAKHIKSNTIVLAKDRTMVGMGAGQPNRVTSVHLALRIADEKARGSVMASDAFFPFADSVEMAGEGGVVALAQPGGSMRDDEVVEAADRLEMAMVITGVRHFKH